MSDLEELISSLKNLKENLSPLVSKIADFDLLMVALGELRDMIEMENVKSSIVSQIKFLMINTIFDGENANFDDHMLHTVLCGPPGCGKTQMGIILAKIWTALGLLKKKKEEVVDFEKRVQNLTRNGKIKSDTIKALQDYIKKIKNDMNECNVKSNLFKIKSLKRELENKNFSYISCLKLIDDILKEELKIREVSKNIIETTIPEENMQFSISVNKEPFEIDKIMSEIKKMDEADLQPKKFDLIRIVSREDFVGGFLGQTAIKTEKLLRDSLGKVLFIDEAYSLINDEKDSYGYECLTTLNRFMSEYPSEIVIIFAGYKDLLEQTIFKAQPGLKRRCTWHFEIDGYTDKGLSKIFQMQLQKNGWLLDDDVDIDNFFKENMKNFPYYGGDTLRLVFYCKICYSNDVFDKNYENGKVINKKILNNALEYLKKYRLNNNDDKKLESHHSMYL